jgi:hypothetical protein
MIKLLESDRLISQLEADFRDAKSEFVVARDMYRAHKRDKPLFSSHDEYQNILLDDLVKLAGLEQRLEMINHFITLVRSGAYDYKY